MKLFTIVLLAVSVPTLSAPYVEYKNSNKLGGKTTEFVRVGYATEKNYYFEIGDDSAEAGYKFKFKNIELKGKIETTESFEKHSLETEVRYTFK